MALSPSRSPRPLARPSPRKFESPSATSSKDVPITSVEHITDDDSGEQKLDFIEEGNEPFDLEINDPFMFEEDIHWPSEDRAAGGGGISTKKAEFMLPSDPGFKVYKEVQAKLLEVCCPLTIICIKIISLKNY